MQRTRNIKTIEILITNIAVIGSIGKMAAYSNSEYYDMMMVLGECHGRTPAAARRYAELYPNRARHPAASVILAAAQRLYETGSVLPNKHDTGCNRSARTLDNAETIIRAVEEEPETSIRAIVREHGLSYSTVQRTLADEKLHAYHVTRVQDLRPEDLPRRKRFCENFLAKTHQDLEFPSRVIFSDESLFTREGIFNTHNMHEWSDENPRVSRTRNFQVRWKINVWAGIIGTQILGPIILPDTLSGVSYLEFLTETLPELLEDVPLSVRQTLIYQQDGAGPHNARVVTDYLNRHFPGRWMGRYGPIRWPARSPDLNPLDFFLWGYCKEKVYQTLPEDPEELNLKLHQAIWEIDEDIMKKIRENLLRRMQACVDMNGSHFEHLL